MERLLNYVLMSIGILSIIMGTQGLSVNWNIMQGDNLKELLFLYGFIILQLTIGIAFIVDSLKYIIKDIRDSY